MKVTPDQLGRLVTMLGTVPLKDNCSAVEWAGRYKAMGLSETRFLFDWFYAVDSAARTPWVDATYASGCNDQHIETALRAAAKEFGVSWKDAAPANGYAAPDNVKGYSILADVAAPKVVSNLDAARRHQDAQLEP